MLRRRDVASREVFPRCWFEGERLGVDGLDFVFRVGTRSLERPRLSFLLKNGRSALSDDTGGSVGADKCIGD